MRAHTTWWLSVGTLCESPRLMSVIPGERGLIGRANADLVERLKSGQELYRWDRKRFYGPFPDNEVGYTVHPVREVSAATDRLKAQLAD